MAKKPMNIMDEAALSQLLNRRGPYFRGTEPSPGIWVKILRSYLRMTQVELAGRTKIAQSHLADIEAGKMEPQVSTLRRIFQAMSCDLTIRPEPVKPLEDVLRGRAEAWP